MFHSIVVPLDGAPLGARILAYLPRLAAPGATVTLVRVVEPHHDLLPFPHARSAERANQWRTLLERDLESQARPLQMSGLAVTTAVRTGDVATEILACARAQEADLIAMTTHGRSGIVGLAQGSVASRVLHGATCPVFVFRPRLGDQTAAPFRTIVVPLDGSPFAARAIPVAQGLARRYGASIAVVEVVQDQYPTYVSDANLGIADLTIWKDAHAQSRAHAGEYVDTTVTRLREAGLTAVGVVREGMPVDALTTFASRQLTPLIVTASHGRTGLSRWLLGSVAEGLVTSVSCPLIVLRAAEEEGATDTAGQSRRIETATASAGAAISASPRSSTHGPMAADTPH